MRFLSIKVPKSNEYTYEQSQAFLSSLMSRTPKKGLFSMFANQESVHFSLNVISINQNIFFIVGTTEEDYNHVKNQLLAQYGNADIVDMNSFDDIGDIPYSALDYRELTLAENSYYPIKTMTDFNDVDPLASVLSAISRSPDPLALFWVQIIITPTTGSWQTNASSKINSLSSAEVVSSKSQNQIAQIQEKIKHYGFSTNIRIIANNAHNINILANSLSVYAQPGGNKLIPTKGGLFNRGNKLIEQIQMHSPGGKTFTLNSLELSSVWHLPSGDINIPNIVWGKRLNLDPPEDLPIAYPEMDPEEKRNLTFIGRTMYKNQERIFGIKSKDRLRHTYIVGKTGSGKSWLIVNMAIEDIRKGAGVAILDPHGDAIDTILDYIPKNRINDVCYFNPADPEYSYPLNILEVNNESQKELIVSGIIAIFYKLYAYSWGPRLEHILRNVLFTLVHDENATLPDILKILNDKKYRNKVLQNIDDPLIHQFWKKEFDTMSDRFANEAVSPILNKVGQFVTSPLIRKIIKHPRSKVNLEDLMNNKKIFLCDLSQGKIGEDNATLLGSMLITQIQIAAMNRAFMSEDERVPFYLYVDEFQNFATQSFSKILSEARKYKLGLTLANQYITQIDELVMGAILGNVGSITAFNVGAQDADILYKEFGSDIEAEDLTTMEKYQMISRIAIDSTTSTSFTCYSLPLPKNVSGHKEKIIEASRRQYGLKMKDAKTGYAPYDAKLDRENKINKDTGNQQNSPNHSKYENNNQNSNQNRNQQQSQKHNQDKKQNQQQSQKHNQNKNQNQQQSQKHNQDKKQNQQQSQKHNQNKSRNQEQNQEQNKNNNQQQHPQIQTNQNKSENLTTQNQGGKSSNQNQHNNHKSNEGKENKSNKHSEQQMQENKKEQQHNDKSNEKGSNNQNHNKDYKENDNENNEKSDLPSLNDNKDNNQKDDYVNVYRKRKMSHNSDAAHAKD